ncbi:MAG TPA: UvrD-helicase domain-containing protein [Steroidobacteraceae bacterium]|nr:UvrD-helicase domain-containing protein [Steroidobacteraceae bacterium]
MDITPIVGSLNDAQRAAVTAPLAPTLVLAGAGSGKTRVLTHRVAWLVQVEKVSPHGILAVTFTNKAAGEMRSRIESLLNVPSAPLWVGTFHGIAHRLLRIHWRDANLPQAFQIMDSEDQQRAIRKLLKSLDLDESRWIPKEIMWFINARKDEGLRAKHLKDEGDPTRRQFIRLYELYQEQCERTGVVDFAELQLRAFELWRDRPDILAHYRSRFRNVLIDEFQDTNTIQYQWLKLLCGSDGLPFAVGDDDQCVAEGTLITMADGSSRPIESVLPGDHVLSAHGSGKFRPAPVTERFVRQRSGRMIRLHLRSGRMVTSTPEHTHLAGYLLGQAPQTYFLYLMHKEGVGYRLGTSQVYTKGQAKRVVGFRQRALQEHADAAWIVRTHSSENEARLDEMLTSLRYGLPTLPFVPRKGKGLNGLVHDPAYINRVFDSLDTAGSAERLLADNGLDPDRPHHVPRSRNSKRRNIVITLCGDRRGETPMHRISIVGVDRRDRGILEALGLSIRPARLAGKSWRFETSRKDFGEIMTIARRIRENLDDARYILQGRVLGRSLPYITAASIRCGMVMADAAGNYDIVERIEDDELSGNVYDLNVAGTHNFVANGIVTHNSIYRWRGARVENLHQFRRDYPNVQLFRLEQNYRSTGNILAAANALIANNNGRLGKNLWTAGEQGEHVKLYAAFNERDEADFVVNRIREWVYKGGSRSDCAILYRSNAQSRTFEEALLSARIPYRVYGGLRFFERAEIKDALAYVRLVFSRADDASFERVVNLPARGIGAKTLDTIRNYARANTCTMWEAAGACIQELGARTGQSLHGFLLLIEQLDQQTRTLSLHEQVDHIINESGLVAHYKQERGDRGEARVENLNELVSAARGFEPDGEALTSPLASFLSHAVLESGEDQADAWEDSVQMMTLHSAKGLEFPVVFLCGMEDGLFPHTRSTTDLEGLEEERRLCYVGTTRAMKQLYLTYAEQRRLHGVDSYGTPSRFIREIPAELIEEIRPRIQVSRPVYVPRRGAVEEEPAPGGIRLGQRVRHGKFGEGVILNLQGQGSHAQVQVNFERQGTKWLMLAYANLEPV